MDQEEEESAERKRLREEEEDKKNRGNYRCSKCNLPKKGHVCPHRLKFRKKDVVVAEAAVERREISVQVELDDQMTLRTLPLEIQGLPESYLPPPVAP